MVELAFIFDAKPDQEWIEVPDWEIAARCHVSERTVEKLQPRLTGVLEIERSKGKLTRYRNPSKNFEIAYPFICQGLFGLLNMPYRLCNTGG